ncbi:hypothetical protein [Xanthobacter autotrophicus]|uniref:hypothetical protein n=1 Tax=Xanthobacter autotrophicus TaxID=280 RepID=UPI003727E9EF
MNSKYMPRLYHKECAGAEEFIAMMSWFNLQCTGDEDLHEFKVKNFTYHLGTGRITRDGCPPEAERGIDALLALLGHSRDELPPFEIFEPERWPGGTFGPPP